MTRPLIIAEGTLSRHFDAVEHTFAVTVDRASGVALAKNWEARPVVAGLTGDGCEPTNRNRGPTVRVAPWLLLKPGLWAWLGYREEWAGEKALPKGQAAFSFRAASVTVHFGYRNNLIKPQMFRMEWSGWARWGGQDSALGFQAGDAAHPHWQFDALESLQRDEAAESARYNLALLKAEQENIEAREFSPGTMTTDELSDIVTAQELSRIHFPSGAHWWPSASNASHAHAPASVSDIEAWLRRSLAYLSDELKRLT